MKVFIQSISVGTAQAKSFICLLIFLLCVNFAQAQVSVIATSGTTGPTAYTTLKGAFDAVNAGTHLGAITITITSGTTETATASLNASGTGSASFTRVLIKPGASTTPTVTGAIAGGPVVKLNGANNVMIDGSNNNTASQDLTISNTSTTTPQVVVIGSVGTAPVTSDTLKNCTIINGAQTSTALIVSDAAAPGTAGYFNNIGIINNSIQKAYIGMYCITAVTGTNGSGTYIANNSVNTAGTNSIRLCGIYVQGLYGAMVTNNTVGNFEGLSAEFDRAIWAATGTSNTTISGNTITGLSYTGATVGYAPIGINISPAITNANINVTGNIITDISSTSIGTSMGIYFFSAASGITIDRNQISNIKNTNTTGYGAAGIMLAGTLTASAVNIVNNFVWDIAGYGTNLWAANSNGNGIVADGGGGYNIYYNTVWLNTNQTATTGTRAAGVLITTNITTANSINLRNNLLVNTQTVGNGNSRMALVVTASTTVLNTFNYNDYYATSGNLVGQGTNATIWNTIAQVQTNMGANSNSVTIAPTFASSTDLHLPPGCNTALSNLGVSIPAITTDIDLETRSTTTPDIGADEFGGCPVVTVTTQPINRSICAGSSTSFTQANTNGTLVQWQVNTGSGFTNITNNSIYSGATGNTLTITGATASMNGYTYQAQISSAICCPPTSTNTVTLTVNPQPSVTITPSGSTTFCTGGSNTLSVPSGTNLAYQWQNASGNISGATSSSLIVTATGNYLVTVTNTVTGCFATSTPTVISVGSGPVASIIPSGTVAICQGTTATLSAGTTAGVTYQWKVNGTSIAGATANTYIAGSGGNYTVEVSSGPSCSNTSAATILSIDPLPPATASASGGTAICQGSSLTLNANVGTSLAYQWLRNGTIISGATANTYTTTTAGIYRVQVSNTATTCKDTSTPISVTVNPLPPASITPTAPAAICEGDTSVLTANGGSFTYQWQLGGSNITNANAAVYKAFAGGSYTVLVTDNNGCQKTSAAVALTVHPKPTATITYSSPLSFCEGSAVVFTAYPGAGYRYQWIKDGTDLSGVTAGIYSVSQTGVYTIRVVDNFNCMAVSSAVPVTVYPKPVPVIIRTGNTFSLTDIYSTYQWYLNNIGIGTNGDGATYTPTENGAYKVIITDVNGCVGTSELYFLFNLAVGNQPAAIADIRVYPNPATSFVTIDNKSRLQLKRLSLINSIGAVVYMHEAAGTKETINTANLAAGMYYLRIETDGGVQLKKLEILK